MNNKHAVITIGTKGGCRILPLTGIPDVRVNARSRRHVLILSRFIPAHRRISPLWIRADAVTIDLLSAVVYFLGYFAYVDRI